MVIFTSIERIFVLLDRLTRIWLEGEVGFGSVRIAAIIKLGRRGVGIRTVWIEDATIVESGSGPRSIDQILGRGD